MTMTETRPPVAPDHDHPGGPGAPATSATPGVLGVFGTGDHVALGRLWIGTALLFLLATLLLEVLVGVESLKTLPLDVFANLDVYGRALSLEHLGLAVLTAIPLLIGVATIVVPRQLGAATVAFPRAMAAAFWGFLIGGAMVVASYLIEGGPDGTKPEGVDLFHVSLAFTCVALILASISLATTVVAMRPAGMTLDRVPAFAWSILVASTLWVAGLAVLVGLLVLLYVDRRYQVGNLQTSAEAWLTMLRTPPQAYAIGIPVLGFAADVVPTLTGHPQKRHGVVTGAIGLLGVVSFGAWTVAAAGPAAHPHLYREALYTALSAAAVLPVLAILGGLVESLVKGKLAVRPPLLFALGSVLLLGAGATAGALRVVAPFHLLGTAADDGPLALVVAAAVLAGLGAIHWWWPQIVGQHLKQPLGTVAGVAVLVGGLAWGAASVAAGFLDEPIGLTGTVRDGVEALNGVSMAGAGLVALGVLVVLANLAGSLGRTTDDTEIPTDPWDGFTLEWADEPAAVVVASPTPLLDQKEASAS